MAQNQREINRLRHIIEEKDREIEMLRGNEEDSGSVDSGITEDLARRINELEGMITKLASNTQVASQDSRIDGLEEMVKKLSVSKNQVASRDSRIDELEGMVKELSASAARFASQDSRIDKLEGMIQKLSASNTQVAPQYSRVNEMEGMVKGLTEELLDIKAEVRKFGKVLEGKEELKPKPEVRRARNIPENGRARPVPEKGRSRPVPEKMGTRPEVLPQKQYVEQELGTATIMQPDGTLAEEPRKNDNDLIVAGNRPAKMYQPKANRDYRGKEEKKPLIYADEDDTVEIKKK